MFVLVVEKVQNSDYYERVGHLNLMFDRESVGDGLNAILLSRPGHSPSLEYGDRKFESYQDLFLEARAVWERNIFYGQITLA